MKKRGADIYEVEELLRKFAKDMRVSENATKIMQKEIEEKTEEILRKAIIISRHKKTKKIKVKALNKDDIYLASI